MRLLSVRVGEKQNQSRVGIENLFSKFYAISIEADVGIIKKRILVQTDFVKTDNLITFFID